MLAEVRKAKGLSQKEMAEMLELPRSTYCEYETGNKTIPADVAEKISKILNEPIASLFLPVRFTVSELK